ncbi:MAG: McrC family protein [Spirosomataceae bacterium]
MPKTISEYGIIRKSSDYESTKDTFSEIFLLDSSFELLKKYCFEQANDAVFQYSIKRGREQVQVKNHVGLIQLKDRTQIEILPKVLSINPSLSGEGHGVGLSRCIFLKMLRCVPNLPFQKLSFSQIDTQRNLPIYDIFLLAFLDEVEQLLARGLNKFYHTQTDNQKYVRGKVLVGENIRQNSFQIEQIFTELDEFVANTPANRILKKAILLADNQTNNAKIKRKSKNLLRAFDDVADVENVKIEFDKINFQNRYLKHYETALQWSKILLQNHSFSPFAGGNSGISLLFPAEQLFEAYIAYGFKRFADDSEVLVQKSEQFLIENHLEKPKFRLIPDIIVQNQDLRILIDTKWKLINGRSTHKNYGIEQSDLYQMYAYGKKYQSGNLCLIYPANEQFSEPLEVFDYESDMKLLVIPFDIANDLSAEIQQIISRMTYLCK